MSVADPTHRLSQEGAAVHFLMVPAYYAESFANQARSPPPLSTDYGKLPMRPQTQAGRENAGQ